MRIVFCIMTFTKQCMSVFYLWELKFILHFSFLSVILSFNNFLNRGELVTTFPILPHNLITALSYQKYLWMAIDSTRPYSTISLTAPSIGPIVRKMQKNVPTVMQFQSQLNMVAPDFCRSLASSLNGHTCFFQLFIQFPWNVWIVFQIHYIVSVESQNHLFLLKKLTGSMSTETGSALSGYIIEEKFIQPCNYLFVYLCADLEFTNVDQLAYMST